MKYQPMKRFNRVLALGRNVITDINDPEMETPRFLYLPSLTLGSISTLTLNPRKVREGKKERNLDHRLLTSPESNI